MKLSTEIMRKIEVLATAFKLGLTSFGGPLAHIGYFHEEYVHRKKWLDEKSFADLVALCQFLPGPASSQLGIGIGTMRAGLSGGILAWIGFTLPSAVLLIVFEFFIHALDPAAALWLGGLKAAAFVIVLQAVFSMWGKLVTDRYLATIALAAMFLTLFSRSGFMQIGIILFSALAGWAFIKKSGKKDAVHSGAGYSRIVAAACLVVFFALLAALPLARALVPSLWVTLADIFYRAGALVFGGGHVVLPLLEEELVHGGLLSGDAFLAGYGATQAMPGPLFAFSAFLGAAAGGLPSAAVSLVFIFLPAWLLIIGVLPFWEKIRSNSKMNGALAAINAAVVGLLLAALYDPLWVSAIHDGKDVLLVIVLSLLLIVWKIPPILGVVAAVAGSMLLG